MGWSSVLFPLAFPCGTPSIVLLQVALPVCLRPTSSLDEFLADLPEDRAIHLCFVGDDEAEVLEICLRLKLRHVSMVDGGWRALEEMIGALGLELLPSEENKENTKDVGRAVNQSSKNWALQWTFGGRHEAACDEFIDV